MGKSARRAYGFDDIAIVPSRRTRDPEDVDISWEIDALRFELPADGLGHGRRRLARPPPSRSAASAASACSTSRASGPATRTPSPLLEEIADARRREGHRAGCRRSTPSRSSPSWSPSASARSGRRRRRRARRSRRSGPTQFASRHSPAELDLLVIQGTVVSAEHVSEDREPLNLKKFIRELDMPGDRRRLRQLPGGAAPHAHRRRRRARRRRPGPRLHHPRRARHRRAPGHGHRRRRAPPACATSTRPASTST